jgi:hypothetical protein
MRDKWVGALRWARGRMNSSRLVVIGVVVTVVLGTAGFLIGRGETGLRLLIQPGDAWLSTNKDGSVTHIDGQTARPTAQLLLKGAAGHQLAVIQVGERVLVLDETTGVLVRINPAQLLLGAQAKIGTGSVVVAGIAATYVVNYGAQTVQRIDPVTLRQLGPTVSLPWPPAPGAVVDSAGTLWLPIPSTGSVVSVTSAGLGRPVRVGAVGADVVMTSANGVPIAVDRTTRRLTPVTLAGAGNALTLPAAVGAGTKSLIVPAGSGSPDVPMVDPNGQPSLVIVNLTTGASHTASLGPSVAGDRFGPPVQAGSRVFIPDYSTGQVLVYQTSVGLLGSTIPVLSHPGLFTAQVIDGIAYFNDPNGNRAVVMTPDGVVHIVSKSGPHVPKAHPGPPPPPAPPATTPSPGNPGGTGGSPPPRHHHTPKPKPSKTPPPPLAPVNPQAAAGAGYVTVSWQKPASGGAVTGYQVAVIPGGNVHSTGSTSIQINGLNCGTIYSFTVSSVGADGKKVAAASVSSKACVPPSAPQGLSPSVNPNQPQQFGLTWSAPASSGGGAVSYAVSVNGGTPTTVTGTSDTVTGLADFQTYSVTVTATSPAGTGAAATTSVNLSAGPWGGYSTDSGLAQILNVRSGPATSYSSVYQIQPGTTIGVTIDCQVNGGYYQDPYPPYIPQGTIWDKVTFSGGSGYIADGYVNTPNSRNNSFSAPLWPC